MPETLVATQWLCQICIENLTSASFERQYHGQKCLPLKLRYYTHEKRQNANF